MRKKKWMAMLAVSMLLAMMFATTAFAAGTGDVAGTCAHPQAYFEVHAENY